MMFVKKKRKRKKRKVHNSESPSMYLGTCSFIFILYVSANWQKVKSTKK